MNPMAIKLHPSELVEADCGDALAELARWAMRQDAREKTKPAQAELTDLT